MVLKTDSLNGHEIHHGHGPHGTSGLAQLVQPGWYARAKLLIGWPMAAVLLVMSSPFIGLMAVLVRLTSRGPAFYSQVRQGRNGETYRIHKLRTMVTDSEKHSGPRWATPDDPRITRLGRFLRKTHLDELPQLWNVLKGEMCLIGPRPERPEIAQQLEREIPHYRERILVRPGLTGLAQVHLPADTEVEGVRRKLAHDLYYIRHMGPWLDLRLLLCTGLYLLRVPFHVSARILGVAGSKTIEPQFRMLWAQMPGFRPHLDFAGGIHANGAASNGAAATTAHVGSSDEPAELGAEFVDRLPVGVVIPCFNEEDGLEQLADTLQSVEHELGRQYDLQWIMVDDGSRDGTWPALKDRFEDWPNVTLVQHEQNRGISAAIRTGIEASEAEVVCSMDADCTYDPHEFGNMIPLLRGDVAMVTASPYHAEGRVLNVPRWRLVLSRIASSLYRVGLRNKLSTCTSCFRVYRRSAVLGIEPSEDGFEGVAEVLARLDLHGYRIVEFPATLSVRRIGRSKMRIVQAIYGHLRLIAWLWASRLFRRAAPPPALPSLSQLSTNSLERTSV
jgi:lipopolysaccharide/colanic/teichoic acid biosynthesis glycosyltransferase